LVEIWDVPFHYGQAEALLLEACKIKGILPALSERCALISYIFIALLNYNNCIGFFFNGQELDCPECITGIWVGEESQFPR
jgi:hypothetical protein